MRIKCLTQGHLILPLPADSNGGPYDWESAVFSTEPQQLLKYSNYLIMCAIFLPYCMIILLPYCMIILNANPYFFHLFRCQTCVSPQYVYISYKSYSDAFPLIRSHYNDYHKCCKMNRWRIFLFSVVEDDNKITILMGDYRICFSIPLV